jgi:hypothetical protein
MLWRFADVLWLRCLKEARFGYAKQGYQGQKEQAKSGACVGGG